MKRIRDKQQFLRYQAQRAKSTLAKRQQFKSYRKEKAIRVAIAAVRSSKRARVIVRLKPGRDYPRVVAPAVLSMIDNPDESIQFFSRLSSNCDRRRKTKVSLEAIKRIDYDAIVVLLSILIRFKAGKVGYYGQMPTDESAKTVLINSGFFESLYRREFAEQDVYEVKGKHEIHSHAKKAVDSAFTAQIIEHASETVWGKTRRSQGAQRVFLELMQNTNNHASLHGQGEKHWWLSVNLRPDEHKVSFTFVDFGVGIFRSLDKKLTGSKWFEWKTKLFSVFRLTDNAEILDLMLKGDFHRTVTGKEFRGKGLPGINEVLERGWISNLLIITNDVYANVSRNDFRLLRNPFRGTLIYWELDQSNLCTA